MIYRISSNKYPKNSYPSPQLDTKGSELKKLISTHKIITQGQGGTIVPPQSGICSSSINNLPPPKISLYY